MFFLFDIVLVAGNVVEIDKFGKQAKEQDIKNSINLYKLNSKKEDKDE